MLYFSNLFDIQKQKRIFQKHCAYSQNKFNFPADLDIRRVRFMFLDPWISVYIKLFVFTLVIYFMKNQLLSSLYAFFCSCTTSQPATNLSLTGTNIYLLAVKTTTNQHRIYLGQWMSLCYVNTVNTNQPFTSLTYCLCSLCNFRFVGCDAPVSQSAVTQCRIFKYKRFRFNLMGP